MSYFEDRMAEIRAEQGFDPNGLKFRKSKSSGRIHLRKKSIKAASPAVVELSRPEPVALPGFEVLAEQLRIEDQELEE